MGLYEDENWRQWHRFCCKWNSMKMKISSGKFSCTHANHLWTNSFRISGSLSGFLLKQVIACLGPDCSVWDTFQTFQTAPDISVRLVFLNNLIRLPRTAELSYHGWRSFPSEVSKFPSFQVELFKVRYRSAVHLMAFPLACQSPCSSLVFCPSNKFNITPSNCCCPRLRIAMTAVTQGRGDKDRSRRSQNFAEDFLCLAPSEWGVTAFFCDGECCCLSN